MTPTRPKAKSLKSSELNRAIQHAVNYHSLDARLNMADYAIADLLEREMFKHLCGTTDVQIYERMTPEERSRIGEPAPESAKVITREDVRRAMKPFLQGIGGLPATVSEEEWGAAMDKIFGTSKDVRKVPA